MKRQGGQAELLFSFENLYLAFKKAFRATKTAESFYFAYHVENEIFSLQSDLSTGAYLPGNYRYFSIYDPKERIISVAPFRDRVVHHALINILEPLYERCFIHDSYATRKNKGTHLASRRAQKFCRQNTWYLKMDIQKYFDSIKHKHLMAILSRKIKDPLFLNLCHRIIAKGGDGIKGLPIGNLSSQFFANVYLNPFDYWIKESLRIKNYLRYMDDFILFHNDKNYLRELSKKISNYLAEQLNLNIKFACINRTSQGLPFLGLRIFPALVRIRKENLKRTQRRVKMRRKEYEKGLLSEEPYGQSLGSLYALTAYWKKTKALYLGSNYPTGVGR